MIAFTPRLRWGKDRSHQSVCCGHDRISAKLGKAQLVFDPGVKINGAYYCNVLLTQQQLPVMREISSVFFIFQQDSAPAHRARETLSLLEQETPAFISPDLWPPNSPDLNLVDYRIWGKMEQCVYQTKLHDVDEFEAAFDRCLAWLGAKRHRRSNWWVAQTSSWVHSSERKTL